MRHIDDLDKAIATVRRLRTMNIEGVPQDDLLIALDTMGNADAT